MTRNRTVEVYQAMDHKWYWRAKASNGEIVADGGEGFASASNAKRAARTEYPKATISVLPSDIYDPREDWPQDPDAPWGCDLDNRE